MEPWWPWLYLAMTLLIVSHDLAMVKPWSPVCKSRGDPLQSEKIFFLGITKLWLIIRFSNMANSLVIAASSDHRCICAEEHISWNFAFFRTFATLVTYLRYPLAGWFLDRMSIGARSICEKVFIVGTLLISENGRYYRKIAPREFRVSHCSCSILSVNTKYFPHN